MSFRSESWTKLSRERLCEALMIELNFLPKDRWIAQRCTARKARVSVAILDYASPEEVVRLKNALLRRFKRVTGETPEDVRHARGCLRQAIRAIEHGKVPVYSTEDLLAEIRARYEAAREKAQAPIEEDETAWRDEEARRAQLQAKMVSHRPRTAARTGRWHERRTDWHARSPEDDEASKVVAVVPDARIS